MYMDSNAPNILHHYRLEIVSKMLEYSRSHPLSFLMNFKSSKYFNRLDTIQYLILHLIQHLSSNILMASCPDCTMTQVLLNWRYWICKLCASSYSVIWNSTIEYRQLYYGHIWELGYTHFHQFLLLCVSFLIRTDFQKSKCYRRHFLLCSTASIWYSIYLILELFSWMSMITLEGHMDNIFYDQRDFLLEVVQ